MQNRRSFMKTAGMVSGTALTVGPLLGLSTCSTVEQDIMNYVPVALTAFSEIITLINPAEAAALAPIIADVKIALADIQAAVVAYENAPAANKATLACKIATAIQVAQNELQKFWSDLNIPDAGLAAVIAGILQIVLSTLMAFVPALNCSAPPPASEKKALKKTVAFTPKKRSVVQFKKDINAELVKGHYAPIFK